MLIRETSLQTQLKKLCMHPSMETSQPVMLTRSTGATKLQIEMCYLSVLVKNPKINLNTFVILSDSVLALVVVAECMIFNCLVYTDYMLVLRCTI